LRSSDKAAAKRAYGSAAKEARKQDILDAAARLFAEGGDQLPSAGSIAEAAGVAKGTVYLYFGTKEEIFALLLLEGWSRVMDATGPSLAEGDTAENAVEGFLASFVAQLRQHPELMRLDAMGRAVLEGNMTTEALAAFKSDFHRRIEATGTMLEARLALPQGRGTQLLFRTHALTRGLWQSFGVSDARAGEATTRFLAELHEALVEYWRGALAR
jgi:AcrR family transcriptional regulator